MLKIAAFIVLLIGAVLFYLSNKNQRLLKAPLNKKTKLASYASFILSFFVLSTIMPTTSAVFIWLMLIMFLLTSVPFVCYLWSVRRT